MKEKETALFLVRNWLMPGKKFNKRSDEQKDASKAVGFYYSPIVTDSPVHHHSSKNQFHKKKNRKFAQTKFA